MLTWIRLHPLSRFQAIETEFVAFPFFFQLILRWMVVKLSGFRGSGVSESSYRCIRGGVEPWIAQASWHLPRYQRQCVRVPLALSTDWKCTVPIQGQSLCLFPPRWSTQTYSPGRDAWRRQPLLLVRRDRRYGLSVSRHGWAFWSKIPCLWALKVLC